MIGKITGRVDLRGVDHVLIDTGGVGYVIYCSERTLAAFPEGAEVSVFTDLLVREDILQLFGFQSPAEREWHRLLMTVQGVGAKAALAIQGALGPEGVARAIALGDAAAIKTAPGVGPKIAQRVVNELKDKAPATVGFAGPVTPSVIDDGAAPAALSALVNLGYARAEAADAILAAGEGLDESSLIREALRKLAPKN